MARSLNRWLLFTGLGLVIVGLIYLPPRGVPRWAKGRMRDATVNESRLLARKYAAEWVETNARLQGLRYRGRVDSAFQVNRARGRYGPVLVYTGPDSLARLVPRLQGILDSVWTQLGLAETKIAVAVVMRDPFAESPTLRWDNLGRNRSGTTYVLPDSGNHTTCLAMVRVPSWLAARKFVSPRSIYLQGWGERALGPCAFYARFGVPSLRVERWLGWRQFDLAASAGWARTPFRREPEFDQLPFSAYWFWQDWVYGFSPRVAACYGGRAEACRAAVAYGDQAGIPGARPQAVVRFDYPSPAKVHLNGADPFLSEVLRTAGPERFQRFWTTVLPVDSALTLALREPVGEFTARYQRNLGPAPRFGAAARPLDAALSLLAIGIVVGLTLLAQGRREVR